MDFSTKNDGENVMVFQSSYELKEDKLLVEINEYYNEIYWPVDNFESFREVVNAAADFNKITLVLKPI